MKLACQWEPCGREFERPSPKGPVPKFCSPSHRQRAYEDRRVERRAQELAAEISRK